MRTKRQARSGAWRRKLPPAALLACVACGSSSPTPEAPPAAAATRDGRFIQDADYLSSQLARLHPNLFFRTSSTDFNRALEELKGKVPSLQDHEVVVGLMRLAALPGDAHTNILPPATFRRLPLGLTRLAGGLYVTRAAPALASALGARVVAIGETPIAEAEARVAGAIAYENDAWRDAQLPFFLSFGEILHSHGLVAGPAEVPLWLEDANGARFRVDAPAATTTASQLELTAAAGFALPLYRQRPQENYWLAELPDSAALYVQYNRCQQASETFTAFAARIFGALDSGRFSRLVVDLRENGGGDSRVDDPLVSGLESRAAWRARGRVVVLTSGRTFSSGMWTADDLRKLGASLVGSPTGGKPNSYGNASEFFLANSGLRVQYSTRSYQLITGSDPPWLGPELAVEPTIDDYREGRDPVLAAALQLR